MGLGGYAFHVLGVWRLGNVAPDPGSFRLCIVVVSVMFVIVLASKVLQG